MENKIQKPYPTDYYLLVMQDVCKDNHQILLIILLKEMLKLNVNVDMIIKT